MDNRGSRFTRSFNDSIKNCKSVVLIIAFSSDKQYLYNSTNNFTKTEQTTYDVEN